MITELTTSIKGAGNTVFNAVRWVCLARGTDKYREVLQHIYVAEDKSIVATDGRRLHISNVKHSLKHGLYRVLKVGRTVWLDLRTDDIGAFPNYKQVIPEKKILFCIPWCETSEITQRFSLVAKIVGHVENIGLNLNYLDDAVPDKGIDEVEVSCTDSLSPVRIDHALGTAVIMSIRV